MTIALVSYATPEFEKKQDKLILLAKKYGIDETYSYTKDWLKLNKFYSRNKGILNKQRGAGYWVWKPLVILSAMQNLKEGDALIYVDAGVEIVKNVYPLVQLCKKQKGILLFNAVNKNKFYTKRDCFKIMGCDFPEYWNHPQFMGGYQVYVKNKKSMRFLNEYLKYVQISHIIDDSPSLSPNFIGFIEHRHDQSILTNLAVKYKVKGFRNPSQGGNHLKKKELRVKGEILNHPY